MPATTYCQRFADSVSTRTHTLANIYTEIVKRNCEETKHNKNLWAAHALLANHKNHIIIASLLGTQGSSPDGTDANAATLTRPVLIPETHRCRKTYQVSQFTEKHTHMLIRDFVDQIFKRPDSLYNCYAKFVVGSRCPRRC